ncbi:Gamma-D-glutamyl-L-diamino acid endopeptidase 1 [Actinobacillus pleuropneumoniae]|nr:Gamma-D-glutamyl-L-diamino acid endopeptidase 1 [Actinobacillus pleuropneumoniae]
MQQYVVQKGDTLRRVAARYGLAYEQLITANPWAAQQPYLQQGQMLYLPASLRRRYVIQEHDTLDRIASTFRFRKEALEELNPGLAANQLPQGKTIVLPGTTHKHLIRLSGEYGPGNLERDIQEMQLHYPAIEWSVIGQSVLGKPIYAAKIGKGPKTLHVNAALHANEWITAPCLMRFMEEYGRALAQSSTVYDQEPTAWYQDYTLWVVPMANPDGVELVQEGITPSHPYYERLLEWNDGREDFRRWKANINGVDLGTNSRPIGTRKSLAGAKRVLLRRIMRGLSRLASRKPRPSISIPCQSLQSGPFPFTAKAGKFIGITGTTSLRKARTWPEYWVRRAVTGR